MSTERKSFQQNRSWIIAASLLALFLGALDALVMSAAMPTVIADLGGLHLYAWAYSSYFLSRAVSLPIFGKLSDLYAVKKLFLFAISLFVLSSVAAGASPSMGFLVAMRVFQGLGTGGIFALVYVVLSDVSTKDERPKVLSFASSIWGIASLVGPTLGGFIVTWFSWRWIFYINLPLGIFSFLGIAIFFKEFREKPKEVYLDWAGVTLLTGFILGLLTLVMVAGRDFPWRSFEVLCLSTLTLAMGMGFYFAERRAKDPMIDFRFFRYPGFALGNATTFCASFAIFAMFAYAPLFLQGGRGFSPIQVGYAMLSLSLGWSVGAMAIGRTMHRFGKKKVAITGSLLMITGCALTLGFSGTTTMLDCFPVFFVQGAGMGFISLSTLLIVQESLDAKDLGVGTSFHQFSRTIGGAIGVGVCGGFVTTRLLNRLENAETALPETLMTQLQGGIEHLLQPEFQAIVPDAIVDTLQSAVMDSVFSTFVIALLVSIIGLGTALALPGHQQEEVRDHSMALPQPLREDDHDGK